MVDWTDKYVARAFPGKVGGGPAVVDTVELTVTAAGSPTATNPVKAAADLKAYFAEDADDKARHDRFSDIVTFFMQHGIVTEVASDGDTKITLGFEQGGMWADSDVGEPLWLNKVRRDNAYELAQKYVASDSHGVTAISVTINGVAQSS